MWRSRKRILLVAAAASMAALAGVLALGHYLVAWSATQRCYREIDQVPNRDVALVLGCSRLTADGRGNLFFRNRIEAAAALYRSHKIRYLIVSGDNSRPGYDEPSDMKAALVDRGVPAACIYRDCAGLRTLDSIARAREIFGVTSLVVVSQQFHAERAIYLASHHGIDAVGFAARDVGSIHGLKASVREAFARVKAVLDVHVLRTRPKFGGPQILVGEAEAN